MTKSGPPNNRWICRYCGLDTGASTNHPGTRACIEALTREVYRLRDAVRHRPPTHAADSRPLSDRANAQAMSPEDIARTIDVPLESGQSSFKHVSRLARQQVEGMMIMRMLQQTRGNRRQAAIELGISYKALLYKVKEHESPALLKRGGRRNG
jgi:DNA-binding NtrC family response regulator